MKKIVAYLPAWGFYWLGDLASRPLHWSGKFAFMLPIYSQLMGWSVFFNDWGNLDVWIEVKDKEENEY